jgi:CHASE3 domain sensor protein
MQDLRASVQDLRAGQRETNDRIAQVNDRLNAKIDRLLYVVSGAALTIVVGLALVYLRIGSGGGS